MKKDKLKRFIYNLAFWAGFISFFLGGIAFYVILFYASKSVKYSGVTGVAGVLLIFMVLLLTQLPSAIFFIIYTILSKYVKVENTHNLGKYVNIVEYKCELDISLRERLENVYGNIKVSAADNWVYGSIKRKKDELFGIIHIMTNNSFSQDDYVTKMKGLDLMEKKKSFTQTQVVVFTCLGEVSPWLEKRLLREAMTMRGVRWHAIYFPDKKILRVAQNKFNTIKKMNNSILEELKEVFILTDIEKESKQN